MNDTQIELTSEILSQAICLLRERWVQRGEVKKVEDINRAWCWSFADEIADVLVELGVLEEKYLGDLCDFGTKDVVYYLCNESFWVSPTHEKGKEPCLIDSSGSEYFPWDTSLLEKWNITPPAGLAWEEANGVPFGYHVFLVFNNRFYDAECPEGVDSFFELPLYREILSDYRIEQEKHR